MIGPDSKIRRHPSQVTGYLRGGRPLDANHLVHIPGFGDFQIDRIEKPLDPYQSKSKPNGEG